MVESFELSTSGLLLPVAGLPSGIPEAPFSRDSAACTDLTTHAYRGKSAAGGQSLSVISTAAWDCATPPVGLSSEQSATIAASTATSKGCSFDAETLLPNSAIVQFSNFVFSGEEGSAGTVQVQLAVSEHPPQPLTLTFTTGEFLMVDVDNTLHNGTQTSLTFTAADWQLPRTIRFWAEVDDVVRDRPTGNTLAYTLSGDTTEAGLYDLGPIRNTYAPDFTQFNIDLDFRNDTTGYWTTTRQAIAQQAANDWATLIANEWTGLNLHDSFSKLGDDGNATAQTFTVKRHVDDLVVFVNTIINNEMAAGFGAIEYAVGGWLTSPDLKPRVGQILINPAVGDLYLYNAVLHELGHTLGLVGLNWEGFLQQNLASPETAFFAGRYSTAQNGGLPIPLQSQDEVNPITGNFDYWHPARSVVSIMSYGWLYQLDRPSDIDAALLADSGYQVYGINVPPRSLQKS